LFIGSSKESIRHARAVSDHLSRVAQVTPWYAGAFGANDYTMEALERQLNRNDFGVFVFSPDDVGMIRGKYVFTTRDNTLFEMGLFWGKLRRQRVFCVVPREVKPRDDLIDGVNVKEYHLLSDLQGLTLLNYDHSRTDGNYAAAMDGACGYIAERVEETSVYADPAPVLKRKQSILAFFSEYNRNITIRDDKEKYHALSEAVRNSFLTPDTFRVTGAAIWQKQGVEGIAQVGGNVGKGEFFAFKDYREKSDKPAIVDVYLTGEWSFFRKAAVAPLYILCYPLGSSHVLSVHILGLHELSGNELKAIVEEDNEELLDTIRDTVGG